MWVVAKKQNRNHCMPVMTDLSWHYAWRLYLQLVHVTVIVFY